MGANVDAVSNNGRTALHEAASSGSVAAVRALLAAGANVDATDKDGRMALHEAGSSGSVAAVRALLAAGANMLATDKDGRMALHAAGRSGSAAAVRALLAAGANMLATDNFGCTALHEAGSSGSAAAVRTLLDAGANVDATDKDGRMALHAAGRSGSAAAVRTLLDAGANMHVTDKDGRMALHAAGRSGSAAAVRTLLLAGANLAVCDKSQSTALHSASCALSSGALVLLCQAGASIDSRDCHGRAPLHLAAEGGRAPVVAALLTFVSRSPGGHNGSGAQRASVGRMAPDVSTQPPDVGVDAVDHDGLTPLHHAAFKGHEKVVAMLLHHGAHPAVVNALGLTPLYIAASLGHGDIVDQLGHEQPAGAVSTPLHGAAKYGHVALFDKPQLRPFLLAADRTGNTALHVAASAVDATSVRALVKLGADVHRRNEDDDTPLHSAVAWLESRVRDAETDTTKVEVHKSVGRRLRRAAAGHLVRRPPSGTVMELPGVPDRVTRKLKDFRAVVLSFLAAGVHVGGLGGGGGGSGSGGGLGHRHVRRLCLRIVRSAEEYGPRQFARLAITGRLHSEAADGGRVRRRRDGRGGDATGGDATEDALVGGSSTRIQ